MQEIERKFLIDIERFLDKFDANARGAVTSITQGYLNLDPERTVRIRLTDHQGFITVKGKSTANGLSRFEWEQPITQYHATEMLKLCVGVIDKVRLVVQDYGKTWEIDLFKGDNEGLVVAEVELTSETESITLPHWITKEVTGDPKYYNSNLIKHPYKDW